VASVAIIGGGISGLSAAYYLGQTGIPSTLIEARSRLGGVIRTETAEGCIVEGGPDSFLSVKSAAMELIEELGLAQEVIGSNDHLRKTFVLRNGRLVPLPDGLQLMIPTRIVPMATTGLVSWHTKLRMALEWFRSPAKETRPDRSVADFVADHYGREAVDYLTEPLLSGVYGGDPQQLSAASVLPRLFELEGRYGSLTRGALAERRAAAEAGSSLPLFRSLRGGMQQLVDTLVSRIATTTEIVRGTAERIERGEEGYRVRVAGTPLPAQAVVLACEAHRAAALAAGIDERLADMLAGVSYSSSMIVSLIFDRSAFPRPLAGFGFLVPRRERSRLVACTSVGTKFPHRVPDGLVLLRCFLGGVGDPGVLDETDEAAVRMATAELERIVGVRAGPRFWRVFRWPSSMAQYTVGHQARVAEIETRLASLAGLHVVGNAYHGIGIPDCIRMAKQVASRIAAERSAQTQNRP